MEIILVDDLDGGKADETVHYAVEGTQYVIDLSASNAKAFRELLRRYTEKSRKDTSRTPAAKARAAAPRSNEAAQAREWARANGYTVSNRGRVQSEILEAYRKAHG